MGLLRFVPSLWQLCRGVDQAWRWHSCLDHRDLGARSVLGCQQPQAQEHRLLESFSAFAAGIQRASLVWVLLYFLACKALKGPPSLGSSSVGQLLALASEREATVMAPSPAHDSAILPYLHGFPAFLQKYSPLRSLHSDIPLDCLPAVNSRPLPGMSLRHPLGLSPCSQQQTSPWDCSPTPMFQLPVITLSRVLVSLSVVRRAVASIVCVAVTPFRLSQMRCCTLQQLKCFPSVPNNCPDLGISLPLQFPHLLVAGPVLLTPLFPSYLHLTEYYMDLYIHFQLSETSSSSHLVFSEIFYT